MSRSQPKLVSSIPRELLPNALALAMWGLEPVRAELGEALNVISWYRNAKLNAAVGGSSTSQHTKASAADVSCVDHRALWQAICKLVTADLIPGCGQIIYYPQRRFTHIALRSSRWPMPITQVHDPARGLKYAHVDPTWEATVAKLRYEPNL